MSPHAMSPRTRGRRNAFRAAGLLAAAAAIGALAGCSSTEAPSASPSKSAPAASAAANAPAGALTSNADTFDACAVLDAADLADIVGDDVQLTKLPSSGWMAGQCSVSTATSGLLASVSVGTEKSIQESADPAGTDAGTRLERFASRSGSDAAPQAFADIGEGAVLSPTGMALQQKGVYVEVANLSMSDDDLVQLVRELATHL